MRLPPDPPSHLAGGIGAGDFWQVGQEIVGLTMATAHVRPADRILDVGCGLGRVAWPLSRLLGDHGTYDGFDTSAEYIDWCRGALGLDPERFRFHHFDIRSSHYNAQGTIAAEAFAFPWPDNTFSLAIATSLFTHLASPATRNYLGEIARTLDANGRLFASFYVLDDDSRRIAEAGETNPRFTAKVSDGMVGDADDPDAAVAFDRNWLGAALTSAGLAFDAFYPGRWRHLPVVAHQDILIAHKP